METRVFTFAPDQRPIARVVVWNDVGDAWTMDIAGYTKDTLPEDMRLKAVAELEYRHKNASDADT